MPASIEVELGKMFGPKWGVYCTGFGGIGEDRPYDWGAGIGFRFRF